MPAVRMRVFVVASIVWWWFVVWTNPIANPTCGRFGEIVGLKACEGFYFLLLYF